MANRIDYRRFEGEEYGDGAGIRLIQDYAPYGPDTVMNPEGGYYHETLVNEMRSLLEIWQRRYPDSGALYKATEHVLWTLDRHDIARRKAVAG